MSYHPIDGGLQDTQDPTHTITLDPDSWEDEGPRWEEHHGASSTPITLIEVLQQLERDSPERDHVLIVHRSRVEKGKHRLHRATRWADEETLAHITISIDRLVEEEMRARGQIP